MDLPGPFPGMDPYLELPYYSGVGLHALLIPALDVQLNRTLPPGFAAHVEERIYVTGPDNYVIPDVVITRHDTPAAPRSGGSAVLDRPADASETITFMPESIRELYIEVRKVGSQRGDVVAAVELLSPTNKQFGRKWPPDISRQTAGSIEEQCPLAGNRSTSGRSSHRCPRQRLQSWLTALGTISFACIALEEVTHLKYGETF